MGVNNIDPHGDAIPLIVAAPIIMTAIDTWFETGIDLYLGNELTYGGQLKQLVSNK